MASLEGLKAVIEDGAQAIDVVVADGAIEARSSTPAGLSYRHNGLSIKGAEIGLAPEVRGRPSARTRRQRGRYSAASPSRVRAGIRELPAGGRPGHVADGERGRAELDRRRRADLGRSRAPRAPSATATLLSENPTGFLLETILSAVLRSRPIPRRCGARSRRPSARSPRWRKGCAGPRYRIRDRRSISRPRRWRSTASISMSSICS